MTINVPVEIFVIKAHSVFNLLPFWSRDVGNGHQRHSFSATRERSRDAACKKLAQPSIVSRVKGIVALLIVAGALTIAACSFFEPGEATREESGRTLYRAAEENPTDAPDVTPLREKVPGESR